MNAPAACPRRDLALVRRALRDRPDARDALAHRMRIVVRFLAGFNRRNGGSLDAFELEDLAQDVFCLLWSKLDRYRGRASLETWAYRFCLLTFVNRVRAKHLDRSRRPRDGEELFERTSPPPDPDLLDSEQVFVALEQLPSTERRVILLRLFDGRTFREIAKAEGAPINTVKARYHRGVARMRGLLYAAFGGGPRS